MAPGKDAQLEKIIGDALKSGDVRALDGFLQRDAHDGNPIKCSQRFLTKLDKLVGGSLDQKDSKSAGLGLAVIYKCGANLKLPGGGQGLSGIIGQGLIKKWFEKCRRLWIECGPRWDEPLFNLSEDFFDALRVVLQAGKEGTCKIAESFLYPVFQLGVDPRIYILIQREAIRKFNLMLDKIPVEFKKENTILTSQETSEIMIQLTGHILEVGDYDLQTARMEALCRMATADERKELAGQWFSTERVATAFTEIRDSEFETDCRRFLNFVNGMQGDRRRVYSYPCLEVFLDQYELLMPADEKLEEFWIDFNLDSRSVSFYFSLADEAAQEDHWETICISEHEVQSYAVTEEGKRKVLQLQLSEVVVVSVVEGSSLTIHFSSALDVLHVARSVYGRSKDKGLVGKTAVKIIIEENSSQVVPESQASPGESKNDAAPSAPVQTVTQAKMRISESTDAIIDKSARRSVRSVISISADTPARGKLKPSLEMVRSCDGKGEFYLGELRTTAETCGRDAAPSCPVAGGTVEQKMSLVKTTDPVLPGPGEEHSQEDSFVPDTQPASARRMSALSSYWSNLSISEMLMMPTQKINSVPTPEPRISLSQQQEPPPSAVRLSAPGSGPISEKLLHAELTQRLQRLLGERNRDSAAKEPAAPRRKSPDVGGASDVGRFSPGRGRSSADRCASAVVTATARQAERNDPTKRKRKGQVPVEADAAPNEAPVKASAAKAPRESTSPKLKTNRALLSKDKRDAEVAESMVKLISSHYEISGQSAAKNPRQSRILPTVNRSSITESLGKTAASSSMRRKDIFAFNDDTPVSIVGKDALFADASAMSSSGIRDSSALQSTAKKGQPVAKEKRHVTKHLFSDTDTDCALTDVSWLRESSRKPKPKVAKYSRQAAVKPKAVSCLTSREPSDFPPPSPKPVKGATEPNKRERSAKETARPAAAAAAAGRRPKRAAAAVTKSYKEPDTEDSLSESDRPPLPKHFSPDPLENTETTYDAAKVKSGAKQPTKSFVKLATNRRSDRSEQTSTAKPQRPESVPRDTSEWNEKKAFAVQEQMSAPKDSWAARQAVFRRPPPLIERLRSVERSAPAPGWPRSPLLTPRGSPLPASPDPACRDTPSPIPLLPQPPSAAGSAANLGPSSSRGAPLARPVKSTPALPSLGGGAPAPDPPCGPGEAETSPVQQHLSPAPRSPSSPSARRPATSSLAELDEPPAPSLPPSPFPEDAVNFGLFYGFSQVTSASRASLSQSTAKSSAIASRDKDSPGDALTASRVTEVTPRSDSDVKPTPPHMSGPSRKRHISSSSDSEEVEKEERKPSKARAQRSPRMKPRKLFTSFSEASAGDEVGRDVSSFRTVSSSHWEAQAGGGDAETEEDLESPGLAGNSSNVCQRFSSELKKKFQSRYQMMELYNKRSSKTVQQHVSSLNTQVVRCGAQRLERVQKVLSEEIRKLEQSDTLLRNMEKDLAIYWQKHTLAFHSYQEQETTRNETLRNALQVDVCHSLEYEQRIFTSQMCLIRKDMKSAQDRLLSEMQGGEMQSVKRGLHALFFPDGARF